jgi:predicted  nucleic acid-binding Zn-ribbon protein
MAVKDAEPVSTQIPADDFSSLEDKIYRTIEMYKTAREGQTSAERDAQRLRGQLEERDEELERQRRELVQLRREREEIRGRVEKMLQQIGEIAEQQAAS